MLLSRLGFKYVGTFEGVKIYESSYLGDGFDSKGLCLPLVGIIVGRGTYSKAIDIDVIRHEYGHILQARDMGCLAFYLCVGIPSLISAWTNGWGRGHQTYWTEGWANLLASQYFGPSGWPYYRFPPKPISRRRRWWIYWRV